MRGKWLKWAFLLVGFLISVRASGAEPELRLLTSIPPLGLIAREIVGEHGRVDVLLPASASAHDYALRPSEARKLGEATLVLWIGPELETFLQRPLANRAANSNLMVLGLHGLHWPGQESRALVPEGAGSNDNHDHDHHHAEDEPDPHLWLDPRNGAAIAVALADRLGQLQPSAAADFNRRAKRFVERMAVLDKALASKLEGVSETGFAVYHEGYMHFVDHYGLRQLGYVTYMPERRPGARHLYQLRQSLKGQAQCLFVEPGYDLRLARDLAADLGLRLAVVSPMGGEQTETYDQLLTAMAEDFLACLAQP